MAAREEDAASKGKAAGDCSAEAAHQKADETTMARTAADQELVARTAAECSDDEDDPVIRNLNLIRSRNLMTPEWIEDQKKMHYEHQALIDSIYDALEKGEIQSDSDDDDDGAAAAERSKRLWAGVDLSGLNIGDGEYAVPVYPAGVYPRESRSVEEDHDAAAAAAESSSS